MKKAANQASPKNKKDVDSLLKVLRPKVYITDSSSFKRLVQELTGNGSKPTSPEQCNKENKFEEIPVIENGDHGEPESSAELLATDSPDRLSIEALSPLAAFTSLHTSWSSAPNESLLYQELDSWLLQFESSIFYDEYPFHTEQELCISDYDLSGIHNSV